MDYIIMQVVLFFALKLYMKKKDRKISDGKIIFAVGVSTAAIGVIGGIVYVIVRCIF